MSRIPTPAIEQRKRLFCLFRLALLRAKNWVGILAKPRMKDDNGGDLKGSGGLLLFVLKVLVF